MSNSFITTMLRNNTYTENGMPANTSSGSALVDMLYKMGSIRVRGTITDDVRAKMLTCFVNAFKEDKEKALKLLFNARDIQEGLGEREFFRINMLWLIKNGYIDIVSKNLLNSEAIRRNIIRVDDIIFTINELIINKLSISKADEFIYSALSELFLLLKDDSISGLVAKWMPRKGSKYNAVVIYMRKHGMISTYSNYRKLIVSKTNVVEQAMSSKNWKNINLEHVPSLAMKKYKKSFLKQGLLKPFIAKVEAGEAKVNASRLYPHDIIHEIMSKVGVVWHYTPEQIRGYVDSTLLSLLNEQWKSLKNLNDLPQEFRAIPLIDVSGSMKNPLNIPISIALGLGFFIAERNPNPEFKDYFISFHSTPSFQKITGADIVSKVANALKSPWGMSTDLEAAFKLILDRAVTYGLSEESMPTHLIILSDGQFNVSTMLPRGNAIQMIKTAYRRAGYNLPSIIIWNVNDRAENLPAQIMDNGVILCSGKSQNMVNFILKKTYENMENLVDEVINIERYNFISI